MHCAPSSTASSAAVATSWRCDMSDFPFSFHRATIFPFTFQAAATCPPLRFILQHVACNEDGFLSDLLISIFGGLTMRAANIFISVLIFFAAFDVGDGNSVSVASGRDASDVATRIIIAGQPCCFAPLCITAINLAFTISTLHATLAHGNHSPNITNSVLKCCIAPQNTS